MSGKASQSRAPHIKTPAKTSRARSQSKSRSEKRNMNPQDQVEVEIEPVSEREFVEDVQREEQSRM